MRVKFTFVIMSVRFAPLLMVFKFEKEYLLFFFQAEKKIWASSLVLFKKSNFLKKFGENWSLLKKNSQLPRPTKFNECDTRDPGQTEAVTFRQLSGTRSSFSWKMRGNWLVSELSVKLVGS